MSRARAGDERAVAAGAKDKPASTAAGQAARLAPSLSNRAMASLAGSMAVRREAATSQGAGPLNPEIGSSIEQAVGSGQPLPNRSRAELEGYFGADLGSVRVHSDARADSLSRSVQAEAFTTGSDVFFREGKYQPDTDEGRHLLAHEVTHTLQRSPVAAATVVAPDDATEVEADELASDFVSRSRTQGSAAPPSAPEPPTESSVNRSPLSVQRRPPDGEPAGEPEPATATDKGVGIDNKFTGGFTYDKGRFQGAITITGELPNRTSPKVEGEKSGVGAEAKIGEAKMSRSTALGKKAGNKASNTMAVTLGSIELTSGEIMPGVNLSVETEAFEAALEKEEIDLTLASVTLKINAELTKEIASTKLGQQILGSGLGRLIELGFVIKLVVSGSIKVTPADIARLTKMGKLAKAQAKNLAKLVKAEAKRARLKQQNKDIKREIQKRIDDAKRKNAKYRKMKAKGRRAPKKVKPDIEDLEERFKKNKKKIKKLKKKIKKNRKATRKLQKAYKKASKRLRSRAARLLGRTVGRFGKKLLVKLIPGINVISTVLDIYDLGKLLLGLADGSAEFALGGGDAKSGTKDGVHADIDVSEDLDYEPIDNVDEGGSGDGGQGGSGETEGAQTDQEGSDADDQDAADSDSETEGGSGEGSGDGSGDAGAPTDQGDSEADTTTGDGSGSAAEPGEVQETEGQGATGGDGTDTESTDGSPGSPDAKKDNDDDAATDGSPGDVTAPETDGDGTDGSVNSANDKDEDGSTSTAGSKDSEQEEENEKGGSTGSAPKGSEGKDDGGHKQEPRTPTGAWARIAEGEVPAEETQVYYRGTKFSQTKKIVERGEKSGGELDSYDLVFTGIPQGKRGVKYKNLSVKLRNIKTSKEETSRRTEWHFTAEIDGNHEVFVGETRVGVIRDGMEVESSYRKRKRRKGRK